MLGGLEEAVHVQRVHIPVAACRRKEHLAIRTRFISLGVLGDYLGLFRCQVIVVHEAIVRSGRGGGESRQGLQWANRRLTYEARPLPTVSKKIVPAQGFTPQSWVQLGSKY